MMILVVAKCTHQGGAANGLMEAGLLMVMIIIIMTTMTTTMTVTTG